MSGPGRPFQRSIMFAGKAEAYLNETSFRCSTLAEAPGLSRKHYTRLEMFAKVKNSTLLLKFVNYGQNFFITLGPGHNVIKRFMSVTYKFL